MQVPEYYFKPGDDTGKIGKCRKNQEKSDRGRKRFVSVLKTRTTEELILCFMERFQRIISTLGSRTEYRDQAGETCGTPKEYGTLSCYGGRSGQAPAQTHSGA